MQPSRKAAGSVRRLHAHRLHLGSAGAVFFSVLPSSVKRVPLIGRVLIHRAVRFPYFRHSNGALIVNAISGQVSGSRAMPAGSRDYSISMHHQSTEPRPKTASLCVSNVSLCVSTFFVHAYLTFGQPYSLPPRGAKTQTRKGRSALGAGYSASVLGRTPVCSTNWSLKLESRSKPTA